MTTFAVVTPVLDGAAFIDRAVSSVLEQDGDVDYVIVDGGSTDGTLERLERFGSRVRVVQHACNQAEAINAGLRMARGDVVAILNADDWFLPGAFAAVAAAFERSPGDVGVVVGGALVADRDGTIARCVAAVPVDAAGLARRCEIVQPAAFVRRDAFDRAGGMNDTNRFTCDYDLWIRLARRWRFVAIGEHVAVTREHDGNKSMRSRTSTIGEAVALLRSHYGYVPYSWVYHYVRVSLPGRVPPRIAVAVSLVAGLAMNLTKPRRYVRDWWSFRAMGAAGVAAA